MQRHLYCQAGHLKEIYLVRLCFDTVSSPNSNNGKVKLFCTLQKKPAGLKCSPKFNTQTTDCFGVISGNAQDQPRNRKNEELSFNIIDIITRQV